MRGQTQQPQAMLGSRAHHGQFVTGHLHDPNSMPPVLVKTHRELDHAVDAAYLA